MSSHSLSNMSIFELFKLEVDQQIPIFIDALLLLEKNASLVEQQEICMRSMHSIKGAARMIDLASCVKISHAMEDCFEKIQNLEINLSQNLINALLAGADLLKLISNSKESELDIWSSETAPEAIKYIHHLENSHTFITNDAEYHAPEAVVVDDAKLEKTSVIAKDQVLRVTAENLNRMLGLAGESLVSSNWLQPFTISLQQLQRNEISTHKSFAYLNQLLARHHVHEDIQFALEELHKQYLQSQQLLSKKIEDLELFSRRQSDLAKRMYDETLSSRMRPFSDGTVPFTRMVRDISIELGKKVEFSIQGLLTPVDRDILEKLEAPLTHIIRNAIDHGIETPEVRESRGKSPVANLRLDACHSAGKLVISISDDGRGIACEPIREKIVEKKLVTADIAEKLSDVELLEFLFLPGFSMKSDVTEISGRGVGLDVVQHMIKQVSGSVIIKTKIGVGTQFNLNLPLTTSVIRALVVHINNEQYAFPLANINATLKVEMKDVKYIEGRQHFQHNGRQISLVNSHEILQTEPLHAAQDLAVILIGDGAQVYGVIVDKLLDEHELVVMPLDARLGKIKDISAAALKEDGSSVLIIDVEDMLRSIHLLSLQGGLGKISHLFANAEKKRKRVLVVDDSLTVRELEKKLLVSAGYEVDVAVDGIDAWGIVKIKQYDLIVTDLDMPKMNGFELIKLIKQSPLLKSIPIVIVSYKDREIDRQRGLEAGADFYLTKSSFHDDRLLHVIKDLIGVN